MFPGKTGMNKAKAGIRPKIHKVSLERSQLGGDRPDSVGSRGQVDGDAAVDRGHNCGVAMEHGMLTEQHEASGGAGGCVAWG
jgi:hypothetical protein